MSVALALGSLGAWAATPGLTFLFANGQKASFAFASKPQIEVTADGLSVSSAGTAAVSYQFDDVERFYFEDDIVQAGISSAEVVPARRPVFGCLGSVVTASGLGAGERFSVADLGGRNVSTAKAGADGTARVDLSDFPAGVYVISTGSGVSFKIVKK